MGGGTKRATKGAASSAGEVVDLIASGRVTLLFADGDSVAAMCRTEDGVVDLGYERGRGWWCSCGRPGCVHVQALQLFSESPGGEDDANGGGPAVKAGPSPRPEAWLEAPVQAGQERATAHRSGWRATAVGTAVVVVGAVAWLAWRGAEANTPGLVRSASPSSAAAASPSSQAPSPSAPAPSPSPSPGPSEPPKKAPERDISVAFPLTARRSPLFVSVVKFRKGTSNCVEHLLDGVGAYLTDCPQWWWPGAPPVALFHVTLLNKGERPLAISRHDFRLLGAGGVSHRTLEMTRWGAPPQTFVPASMRLDPQEQAAGWMAFDWSSPFVPRLMVLPRKGYTITIRFIGTYSARGGT